MIFLKKIKLIMILLLLSKIAFADNIAITQRALEQNDDDEIIYPENINKLSKELFEIELKNNQQNPAINANCSQDASTKFSTNSQINLLDYRQLQKLQSNKVVTNTSIPKSEFSQFNSSIFYSNKQIEDLNEVLNEVNKQ